MPSDPDVDNVIAGVKFFILRQRNPLLDRIDFFERRQQKGECRLLLCPIERAVQGQ